MPDTPTDDVNDLVASEWEDDTTPFDRVRAVMKRAYEPRSAPDVAERAMTTPTTARKHLRTLANSGFVDEVSASGDTTLYRRSNESLVLEQAHDILDETDRDSLVSRIAEMRDEIRSHRERFDAESPEDAVVRDADVDRETLRSWQTTRRNLKIARVALALSEAEETVRTTKAV